MDIFFNELSIKTAATDNEADQWLQTLANTGKHLKQITESLEEFTFTFRRKEDFGEQNITENQTISEFLHDKYRHSDPVYIFLLGVFDSPYITDNDPQKSDHQLISISLNGENHDLTGIAAAHLKNSLVVSLNSDIKWDTCELNVLVNSMNESAEICTRNIHVKHASQKQHIIDCHLPFLAKLYDWLSYKPEFQPVSKRQTILPLIALYSLYIGENFYACLPNFNAAQRVGKITKIADKI